VGSQLKAELFSAKHMAEAGFVSWRGVINRLRAEQGSVKDTEVGNDASLKDVRSRLRAALGFVWHMEVASDARLKDVQNQVWEVRGAVLLTEGANGVSMRLAHWLQEVVVVFVYRMVGGKDVSTMNVQNRPAAVPSIV